MTVKHKIKRIKGDPSYWRQLFAVFVEERQEVLFGQLPDGQWQVPRPGGGGFFLTRRAARKAALEAAGVEPAPTASGQS